ncbi:DNA-directed RNA polymerase [Limtongia smithiae]|uniref:DNA-directed RNA polymerase n=1 Tax=Limtongia smithiae TaxID=1125753 RepID=UPI0034CDD026
MPSREETDATNEPVENAEMADVDGEEEEEEGDWEAEIDPDKIQVLPGASEDGTAASFRILHEDHTLGNALRYMIMKNPSVEFCGYSIPHPSEAALNIRIQTYGEITAIEALEKGLDDLVGLCDTVESSYRTALEERDFATEEP